MDNLQIKVRKKKAKFNSPMELGISKGDNIEKGGTTCPGRKYVTETLDVMVDD